MTDLTPEREQEIRDHIARMDKSGTASPWPGYCRDLLAALDTERARNRELEQRIHRQRVELAAANDENRRGNEFARRTAEARCADLEAVAEAAREYRLWVTFDAEGSDAAAAEDALSRALARLDANEDTE